MQRAGDGRMIRLLKYPVYIIVLTLAVAIGAYIVGAVSLEDIVPSHPEQKAAATHLQPAPPASTDAPAAPASASTDNERGYGVAHGLEWLASYVQSAASKVEQLLFADAPDNAEVSTDQSAGPPAAAPASASTDNEQGYGVAGWLASYAQSATATRRRTRRFPPMRAPVPALSARPTRAFCGCGVWQAETIMSRPRKHRLRALQS